jgi:hypothetical protein
MLYSQHRVRIVDNKFKLIFMLKVQSHQIRLGMNYERGMVGHALVSIKFAHRQKILNVASIFYLFFI